MHPFRGRAVDEARTRDPNRGRVVLYLLSYYRRCWAVNCSYPAYIKERYALDPAQGVIINKYNLGCPYHPLKLNTLPVGIVVR